MFEKQSSNRKYHCFVCGMAYETVEDFNNHIIANHEEGREYIKCPVCECAVRDLKCHFKVKHPFRQIPKNIQTRVPIWKDFKFGRDGSVKEKKTRKPSFRQGTFSSKKCGRDFEYKSGLECDFFECLEADNDVLAFAYEGMKIPYFYQGEWHNYIPDIKVMYIDGTIEIWEIKPASQTTYEQNQAKWAAAHNYFFNHGHKFIVQTEMALNTLKSKIKKQHLG